MSTSSDYRPKNLKLNAIPVKYILANDTKFDTKSYKYTIYYPTLFINLSLVQGH